MLQALHYHKDKIRISNLLLSIKFTRSLPLKIYRKGEANLIFGKSKKRFFSYAFLIYALCHKAKSKILALAKLNMEFFTIKFWQKHGRIDTNP